MGENIDPTWICCASTGRSLDVDRLEAGIERVRGHYARLVDYPLIPRLETAGAVAVASIADAEPYCRWPHFAFDERIAVSTAYVPTGWERLATAPLPDAPIALGHKVLARPDEASRQLNAPAAVAVVDRNKEALLIVNDALGAARVYEATHDGITAWSNRPGALVLLLGMTPRADERAWRVLAAASWFLADTAPIEGMRRLPGGTVVTATARGAEHRRTRALAEWVTPDEDLETLTGVAIEHARAQAEGASELWPGQAAVDLSGGRDSRLSAAAVVAAGTDAVLLTSDAVPGEAEVARELIAAVSRELEHRVTKTEAGSATPSTGLLERAANLHLLHDGVRHPQKLRGKNTLPRPRPMRAAFSGHGGEIAHGFFYKNAKQLRKVSRRSSKRVPARIMRFFTKDHEAARPEAYEEARRVVDATLAVGRDIGLDGPVLLDWFYLVDRFAHRSGLATDSERISVFATPGFVKASFALEPEDRTTDRLHLEMTGRLVPQWRDVPYFEAPRSKAPTIRRDRLWEIERDVPVFEGILAGGGSWTELYEPERVKSAWRELREGSGSAKWEGVFEGIVYRHTFDEHLRGLRRG